jgi:DNA-binding transcriptional ArsR family regulator
VGLTIDVRGVPDEGFRFSPSPLAELTAMLHVLVEPAHHPERHAWTVEVWSKLAPELRESLVEADFLWRSSRADFFLPAEPRATLREELDAVDALSDEDWVDAALITTSCGSLPTAELRSPLAGADAAARAVERAAARGPRQGAFARSLLADPGRARGWVRSLLERCEEAFFAETWQVLLPALAADARTKRDLLLTRGAGAALRAVSTSIGLDGGHLVVDKLQDNAADARTSGVTFLPTVFGHPHLLVVHAPGWRPVVQYPLGAARESAPTLDVLRLRLRALDHPVRIRLLRTLARGPHTTSELAAAWDLSAPEVSRHLRLLKDAGMVASRRRGRFVEYEFDRDVGARLGVDVVEALLR